MTATLGAHMVPPLEEPGQGGGLRDVFRHRYLLRLLVRKELRVRYQGTVFGFAWSYVKPLVRFAVYFVVIGFIMGLDRRVPNFAVHIVAGMVMVHYFNETFSAGTKSVVKNRALVQKIYLPREMFPVASTLVSAANIVPGLIILFLFAVLTGWYFEWVMIPAVLLGFALMTVFGMAVGLLFSAFNVYYRDFSKVVEVLLMLTFWSTPLIYGFDRIWNRFVVDLDMRWAVEIYLANPLAIVVMLFQRAFWLPTVANEPNVDPEKLMLAPNLFERGLVMLVISVGLLFLAQRVFTRLEASFAEQL
ncbi:MAG: ABC transporter permease [Actinomycetota bacterium]|nr:ABC transporter permease [Actinomycetota bacterium]